MVWVSRGGDGSINGVYANAQFGYAEEQRPGDDASVLAYLNPPAPIPDISRRQFYQQLAIQGVITQPEALAVMANGTLPASLQSIVNGLPADQQFGATMLLVGASTFQRSHPMTAVIGAAEGWSSEQIDALFTAAAVL
jgi:hypothetical protein